MGVGMSARELQRLKSLADDHFRNARRLAKMLADGGKGDTPRGFAAIGLERPKSAVNIGSALRAAMCYGAASIAISGERVDGKAIKSAANTTQTQRHIPVHRGELRALIPYGSVPVAVDLVDDAIPLPDFCHPHSAFYIFGPEDGTLDDAILSWCPLKVMVPTRFCMNLAATVNVVLYDRLAKQFKRQRMAA